MTEYVIRKIELSDNADIAHVIRVVSTEYGLTEDKGFSIADPTLDTLFQVYQQNLSRYWVIELNGKILGGAGIAPLGGKEGVCELQKMYFLPEIRGKGLAKKLTALCFDFARKQGFSGCYLETTANLSEAIALYHKLGFKQLDYALGNTGHCDCEVRMLRAL